MNTLIHKELKKLINFGNGRANANRIVDALYQRKELFPLLMEIYLSDEEPVSRRAAWAIDLYSEKNPELLVPYITRMAEGLFSFQHDGMKRHTLRMLGRFPLPEHLSGSLITLCFDLMLSCHEAPAIKVYAMEILYNASIEEPDLRQELADSITLRFTEESAGFQSRGEKILERLSRLVNSKETSIFARSKKGAANL